VRQQALHSLDEHIQAVMEIRDEYRRMPQAKRAEFNRIVGLTEDTRLPGLTDCTQRRFVGGLSGGLKVTLLFAVFLGSLIVCAGFAWLWLLGALPPYGPREAQPGLNVGEGVIGTAFERSCFRVSRWAESTNIEHLKNEVFATRKLNPSHPLSGENVLVRPGQPVAQTCGRANIKKVVAGGGPDKVDAWRFWRGESRGCTAWHWRQFELKQSARFGAVNQVLCHFNRVHDVVDMLPNCGSDSPHKGRSGRFRRVFLQTFDYVVGECLRQIPPFAQQASFCGDWSGWRCGACAQDLFVPCERLCATKLSAVMSLSRYFNNRLAGGVSPKFWGLKSCAARGHYSLLRFLKMACGCNFRKLGQETNTR
jgi:hypothetical protein